MKSPESYEAMRIREIKNGRLAMVAWLGFAAQAAVTAKGPLENLFDFLEDPSRNNLLFHFQSNFNEETV
jgi:light-harvesting complex II chlorophyll a/b binding protein 7